MPAEWQVNLPKSSSLDWGVGEADGRRFLYLRSPGEVHAWWTQEFPGSAGDSYRLTWEARGFGPGEEYNIYVGAGYVGAARKWLGFTQLQTIARASKKWPNVAKPAVEKWKTFESSFTLPPGTVSFGLRFGLGASSPAQAEFRSIKLVRTSQTVEEALQQAPEKIPVEEIRLLPVSANGVTLTPDWTNTGAQTDSSATRLRLCLNGLWAIQPADGAPSTGDWAFFKVPGYFNPQMYSIYGLDKVTWSGRDIYRTADPIWYVREVQVPVLGQAGSVSQPSPKESTGNWLSRLFGFGKSSLAPATGTPPAQRVFLDVGGMWGYAIRVYWNGKPVGVLENQLGGRIDLTDVAKPGEKGQLAIYALGVKPADPRFAYREDFVRKREPVTFGGNWSKGFHDIYLTVEPERQLAEQIRLLPSVRHKTLEVRVPAQPSGAGLDYKFTVTDPSGGIVLEKKLENVQEEDGWLSWKIPWEDPRLWNPDDPWLYRGVLQVKGADGSIVDESLPVTFGFREIWVEGKDIFLNGHPLRLRPRLTPLLGNVDKHALRRMFSFFKDMGFNCVLRVAAGNSDEGTSRMSAEDLYATADEMGMLLISYTPYNLVSGGQWGDETIPDSEMDRLVRYVEKNQIQQAFNHPSVIAWSGFGYSPSIAGNPFGMHPDIWGQKPLDQPGLLDAYIPGDEVRRKDLKSLEASRRFVRAIKQADSTRPFLSHLDAGQGDGWGTFDYFNWTPTQEWEEWPAQWAEKGVMPMGSTEHGLPYPGSFVNHAPAGGDLEPWVTEYVAAETGDSSYFHEPASYLEYIARTYDPKTKNFAKDIRNPPHDSGKRAVEESIDNVQRIWAARNRAIYRAWRTYGVSMGLEPFGPATNYIKIDELKKGDGTVVADPSANLKTTGAKQDRWTWQGYWPFETMISYPEQPVGRKPAILSPLGDVLAENNSPLLAYIAGASPAFTAKDHVFWSGEKVRKQLALVWDGFVPAEFVVTWKAMAGGREIGSGEMEMNLPPGEIALKPFEFDAPVTTEPRLDGEIEMAVRRKTGNDVVARDRFAFQVYSRFVLPQRIASAKVALFDPAGESRSMFERMGVSTLPVASLDKIPPCDLLVIGRHALERAGGSAWLAALPPGTPILILEQTDKVLEKLGLRAFPTRTRQAFTLPMPSALSQGMTDKEFADWRVAATLLPPGAAPLKDGYNFHTGYRGAVASVTIETPTRGNFTPHLQSGFDLRETPLLETVWKGHPVLFSQLSLTDGAGIDPAATRVAANILDYLLAEPVVTRRASLHAIGDVSVEKMIRDLGGSPSDPANKGAPGAISLVGTLPADPSALAAWIRAGGTAVVLPQAEGTYRAYFPGLKTTIERVSLIPWKQLPGGRLLAGLGQNDFHYRQALEQIIFDGGGNIAEIPDGKGRWVLLGFDPRKLDVEKQPYLRLTMRHQYRALAQILGNLGADLSNPVNSLFQTLGRQAKKIPVADEGVFKIREAGDTADTAWTRPGYNDAQWAIFDPTSKRTPYGKALVRASFKMPPDLVDSGLAVDLGTVDDYDEVWLNGVKIGETSDKNTSPDQAYSVHRVYPIPGGLLAAGENVLAIRAWNRNADSKDWKTWLRGPIVIRPLEEDAGPYIGEYKRSDDPYLQMHW